MKEALEKNVYPVPFHHFKISQTLERKNLHREVSALFFNLLLILFLTFSFYYFSHEDFKN